MNSILKYLILIGLGMNLVVLLSPDIKVYDLIRAITHFLFGVMILLSIEKDENK